MRCFAALVPPATFLEAGETVLFPYMRSLPGWRPVPSDRVHLTLAFLPDAGTELLGAAREAVESVATGAEGGSPWAAPVGLRFGPVKAFPSASRPRVLAMEPISGGEALTALWNGFNEVLYRAALARQLPPPNPQWRPGGSFKAHLSLARPIGRGGRGQASGASPSGSGGGSLVLDGMFLFERLVLYQSVLGPYGPRYTPLAQARLTA